MPRKLNDKAPQKGMFIQAYLYRKGLGGGVHSFMVMHVGRKYVDLFYPPRLLRLRFTFGEWRNLALTDNQREIMTDKVAFLKRIQDKADQYARHGVRFSEEVVREAMSICGGKYVSHRPQPTKKPGD